MKIGIDATSVTEKSAGFKRYLMQLVKGLAKIDKKNDYILFINRRAYNLIAINQLNFKNIKVYTPPKIHFYWGQVYFPLKIMFEKLDLLFSPVSAPPILCSVKKCVVLHDLAFFLFPETIKNTFALFYWKFFMLHGIKKAENIITDSKSTKSYLMKHLYVPEKKIEVIYGFINNEFKKIKDDNVIKSVKEKYSLPRKYILYVGTIEPRKNISTLIKAYHKIRKESLIKHSLVIVGKKGWGYSNIFETIKELNLEDDIIFTGYVPDKDLPALYNAADLFVYIPLHEGFGYPPLEAMCCEIPVVVSNTSSLPEIVGDGGVLVDPYNVDEIAEQIIKLLNNEQLRKKIANEGYIRSKNFPMERSINKLLEVFRNII